MLPPHALSPMSVQKPLHHLVDDDTYFFNLTLDFITLLQQSRA